MEAENTGTLVHGLIVMTGLLGLVGIGRIVIDRVLAPSDLRRQLASQILIYGATGLFALIMTGDRIKGKEAEELGLVNFYVEDDAELMPKALEIAERLASGAPQAIAASKMAINAYLRSVSSMARVVSKERRAT